MEKYCYSCDCTKDIRDFYANKASRDGFFKRCKSCCFISSRKREIKNKELRNEALIPSNGECFLKHDSGLLVSNKGRVYRPYYKDMDKAYVSKMSTQTLMANGYFTVSFNKKRYYVHKLVADVFCKNTDSKDHVNHKDCDKKNNNSENLEWVTHSENLSHGVLNNRYSKKLTPDDVLQIKRSNSTVKELSLKFSVSRVNIRYILNGKIWKHIVP